MNDQTLLDTANRIIEAYDLDYGNAETLIQNGSLYMSVEAPNNDTIGVAFDPKADERDIRRQLAAHMYDFDADEKFDEYWSPDFAEHNQFSPSQFINMLQEDQQFFEDTANSLMADKTPANAIAATV